MKVIAIADLHIKRIPGVCWGWSSARYRSFIDDLVAKCVSEKAMLIIAGDTLDSSDPKKEELQIFMNLLHDLNVNDITTLLVSGNHETLKQKSSILDFLGVERFSNVHYRRPYFKDGVKFHLVNHDEIHTYRPVNDDAEVSVLVSHFRCNVNQFITEEIDVDTFIKPYDLCIAGDIHQPLSRGKLHYTNQPLNSQFEPSATCGYLEIDISDSGEFNVVRRKSVYHSLRTLKTTSEEWLEGRVAVQKGDFYRIEIEGTPEELRKVKNVPNAIIQRIPVVPKAVDTVKVMEIDPQMTTEESLVEYMKSLEYDNSLITDMMTELRREG